MKKKPIIVLIYIIFVTILFGLTYLVFLQSEYVQLKFYTNSNDFKLAMYFDTGNGFNDNEVALLQNTGSGEYSITLNQQQIKSISNYRIDFDSDIVESNIVIEKIILRNKIVNDKVLFPKKIFNELAEKNNIELVNYNMGEIGLNIIGEDPYIILTDIKDSLTDYLKIIQYKVITSLGVILLGIFFVSIVRWLNYRKTKLKSSEFLLCCIWIVSFTIFCRFGSLIDYNDFSIIFILVNIVLAILLLVILYNDCNNNFSSICLYSFAPKWNKEFVCVILLAIISYIVLSYNLGINEYFHNDEHYVMKAAVGFLNTGDFLLWDFVNEQPMGEYTRAWPHTLLVALVFKIFGVSLVAARMVSVVFGVLFIISIYYIVRKLSDSISVAIMTSVFLLVIPELVDIFRTVRMYSISMLSSIWLFYFSYKTVMCSNGFKSSNKIIMWISKNFDFNIRYLIITMLLVVVNYIIMANSLFIVWGVIAFIAYLLWRERNRKYLLALILFAFLFLIFLCAYRWPTIFPNFIQEIIRSLKIHLEYSSYDLNYYFDFIKYPFGVLIGTFLYIASLFFAYKKKLHGVIVSGAVFACSFLFFYLFTRRIFVMRYMIYALPCILFCIAYGLNNIIYWGTVKSKYLLKIFTTISLIISFILMGKKCYNIDTQRSVFTPAYASIKEYINIDEGFPFISSHFQSYYLQNYEKIDYFEIEDVKGSLYNPFVVFNEVLDLYSEGIVSMETEKFSLLPKEFQQFLVEWTQQIAGTGIDNYNVELFKFSAINMNSFNEITNSNWNRINENMQYMYNKKNGTIMIKFKTGAWLENAEFICIKINDMPYQFIVPDQINAEYLYAEIPEKTGVIDFGSFYGICSQNGLTNLDGVFRENYIFTENKIVY